MKNYAKIVVDIPVADLDRIYDYSIPDSLKNKINIGTAVLVPFGRRKVAGFVVGFSSNPGIEETRVKGIQDIIIEDTLFNKKMLELLEWVADYYRSYLIKVIKTAIPTGLVSGKISKKQTRYLKLKQSSSETEKIINRIKNRAPKQAAILKVLKDSEKNLTASSLTEKADTYHGTVARLVEKGYLVYTEKIEERRPFIEYDESSSFPLDPTGDQRKAIKAISKPVINGFFDAFLLHGVTGSGKTEVYLQVINRALEEDKGAIVLVPEISLTPVMVRRFYSRFGDQVAVLHSNLSLGERYDEWRRLKNGEARIAIGARSAIFAPVNKLGVIIIDEEHENSYKQGENPYYHACRVALKRGRLLDIPVVFGSATPSLESYHLAKEGVFKYLKLPERIVQKNLPPVKVIDMREELKTGNTSIFSLSLQKAIKDAIESSEQVLIFLNRRGYANFVLCRECGHVISCRNCDISLTHHADTAQLQCHYCNYSQNLPRVCPECGSRYIRDFGIGTERIEEELKKLFPKARVDRMDVDTTTRKGAHRRILKKLERGETDILVGTQMIAKGHDYPNVSVVGVITADTILNLPDFRSSERTFQLLTQVAGRTGRGQKTGRVLIQTYTPEHFSIRAARDHNYQSFFNQEISLRKKLSYPPFSNLVNLIVKGRKEEVVARAAKQLGDFLSNYGSGNREEMLGPSPATINKIRGNFRWQIILKFMDLRRQSYLLQEITDKFLPEQGDDVYFNIDVDPLKML